jgi:glycosyltransferase involved in cell wall biosynthesis
LVAEGHTFDLVDAHYFYPDGVAATWLAKDLGIPAVVTARGTDVNVIPNYVIPRHLIRDAARHANALITVSNGLKERLVELGVEESHIVVLRNGVDTDHFYPVDRQLAREHLALTRRTLASVGHLVARKGHHLAIEALTFLADTDLLIVGNGPERGSLEDLAVKLGVRGRVRFLEPMPQTNLRLVYNAVDALVLASSAEGWANVLLEAMACGTPVVASTIPGTIEVVTRPEAGRLMGSYDARSLANAAEQLLATPPERDATRRYAQAFSWDSTTAGQLKLFQDLVRRGPVTFG